MTPISLKVGGERARVGVAEAQKILQRWNDKVERYDDAVVTKLDLSGRSWPLQSLEVFTDFFKRIASTIEILKMDDIIAGLLTDDGLATLEFLARMFQDSPIQELNLNDNALGTRGADVLKPLLVNKTLKSLYLNNCGLSQEVGASFLELLKPAASRLTALSLGRNQMGPRGARLVGQLIASCTQLEYFSYAGSRPLVRGTLDLAQGLAQMVQQCNSSLRYLDLNDCNFNSGEDDNNPIHALCRALEKCPKLSYLVLRDGGLGPEGLKLVLEALKTSGAGLRHLDLGAIEAGPEGAQALGTFIAESQLLTLQELIFDTNELGNEGVASLVKPFGASNAILQKLDLESNELEGLGTRALIDNEIESLQELKLSDNMDIPLGLARQLQAMYPKKVTFDDDLEEEEEEEAIEEVDALAKASGNVQV